MSALDFLVELGTEELPPKALAKLAEAFCAGIEKGLKDAGLNFAKAQAYYASREQRGFPMADLSSPRLRALLGEEECQRIEALRAA